ncbi:MAG: hypothetical protein CME62_12550 [Halobacteriovoraceae bacterium]|nr:hypothetical protein [Halobacteriovoraceae bacterium]
MNKKFFLIILTFLITLGCFAAPVETAKIMVPEFSTKVSIQNSNFHLEQAYLELRAEFIKCVVACKYDSKVKKINLYAKQISEYSVMLENSKKISKRFLKAGARLSECGVNIVLVGRIGTQKYLTRQNLYKRYSDAQKNNCADTGVILKLVNKQLSKHLMFNRFLGPL